MKETNTLEYFLAVLVVVESGVLYLALTRGVEWLAYILPGSIAIASTLITWLAFRDFFARYPYTAQPKKPGADS